MLSYPKFVFVPGNMTVRACGTVPGMKLRHFSFSEEGLGITNKRAFLVSYTPRLITGVASLSPVENLFVALGLCLWINNLETQ